MKALLCVWIAACVAISAEATHHQADVGSSNGLGIAIAQDDAAESESATVSSFGQRLDKRVQRFDTTGKTLVSSVVDLHTSYRPQLNTRTVKPQLGR